MLDPGFGPMLTQFCRRSRPWACLGRPWNTSLTVKLTRILPNSRIFNVARPAKLANLMPRCNALTLPSLVLP